MHSMTSGLHEDGPHELMAHVPNPMHVMDHHSEHLLSGLRWKMYSRWSNNAVLCGLGQMCQELG